MVGIATSRRRFLERSLLASAAVALGGVDALAVASQARSLRDRFSDLSRHFVFEYYPWYGNSPYKHWNQDGRLAPADLAANHVPKLGAYDSASTAVMAQHARWIRETGAGAINVSWWGPGSDVDALVPSLMDVMAAHDIKVTFHLEPYRARHAATYASDIEYLIRKYGEGRKWDCFLLLRNEDGSTGPLFKSFRTILPDRETDCRGQERAVDDYTPDSAWREQTDRVRRTFARDFACITLLADSLDVARTQACGFDGIAVYDNYVHPETWRQHALNCSARDLLFSFNANPGFDGVVDPRPNTDGCATILPFDPPLAGLDWSHAEDRARAAERSTRRIGQSFETTMALQSEEGLSNARRGFLLVYLKPFNEWHEGHQFEPMKDAADLTTEERRRGYHNPADGSYRLKALTSLIRTTTR